MEGLNYGWWLVLGVTIAYVGTAAHLVYLGNKPLAIIYGSYAMANVGFLMLMK